MKKAIALLLTASLLGACATGGAVSTGSGESSSRVASPESQARELTDRMRTTLNLSKVQEDKVLSVNVVHQKLLERIRQNNEPGLATSARENYHKELKGILSEDQFSKFRSSFPNL